MAASQARSEEKSLLAMVAAAIAASGSTVADFTASREGHTIYESVRNGNIRLHGPGGVQVFTAPTQSKSVAPGDGKLEDRTGHKLWWTATVFIDYLRSTNMLLPGSRVCELGAGCGSVGFALHFGAQCQVVLTDLPEQLPLLKLNAGLNAVNARLLGSEQQLPTIAALRWGDEAATNAVIDGMDGQLDFIVASDVVYSDTYHTELLETMAILAHGRRSPWRDHPAPVLMAVGDHMRPGLTHSRYLEESFIATSKEAGWKWTVEKTIRAGDAPWRLHGSAWNAGTAIDSKLDMCSAWTSDSSTCPVVILRGTAPRPMAHGDSQPNS
jgi:predicted nicotinamide N-methyase